MMLTSQSRKRSNSNEEVEAKSKQARTTIESPVIQAKPMPAFNKIQPRAKRPREDDSDDEFNEVNEVKVKHIVADGILVTARVPRRTSSSSTRSTELDRETVSTYNSFDQVSPENLLGQSSCVFRSGNSSVIEHDVNMVLDNLDDSLIKAIRDVSFHSLAIRETNNTPNDLSGDGRRASCSF